MSERELKKLEELRNLKAQKKLKKNEETKQEEGPNVNQLKADSLPQLRSRKGQFEMIPDFLQKKQVQKDMYSLQENDIMAEALKKQDATNENQPSMSELFAQKRKQAEEALASKIQTDMIKGKPSESQIAERKAKLQAQRDALRKQKEEKRKEQLQEFNAKTETKEDLFSELKKMDQQVDAKRKEKQEKENQERRLEMMRKARSDVEQENRAEANAVIKKKSEALDKKDKQEADNKPASGGFGDDWFDNLKVVGTNE